MAIATAQRISLILGVAYVLIGVLGFIPGVTVTNPGAPGQGLLLGIFAVNPIHNIIHLVAGLVLIVAGLSADQVLTLNKVMAVVFLILVPVSLIAPVAEGVAINTPDTLLHLVSFLITGYVGFMSGRSVAQ